MSYKKNRNVAEIKREIGNILEEDVNNELIKNVSITDITTDDDFTFAKVYFMTREKDYKKVEQQLNKASSYIRKNLAKNLNLRSTPELRFVYDDTIDYANKIDKLLEENE